MQISGETNNLDLYSEARDWCGIPLTDTTTLPLSTFVRSANFGLDRVNVLVLRSDGKWQFDDTNNSATELLDTTSSLVSGTEKYAIALTWLKIKRIRIKDSAGNWITLISIDRNVLSDSQLRADAGDPKRYDKLGNWIYLYPKPNYSSSGGIEVQFQQGPSYFVFDDTTKTPGFATHLHVLIALYGALDYCEKNDLDTRAKKIKQRIGNPPMGRIPGSGLEGELVIYYSTRDADQKVTLTTRVEDYGQLGGGRSGYNRNGFNF